MLILDNEKYIIQIILFALAVLISVIIYNYYFKNSNLPSTEKNQIPTLDKNQEGNIIKNISYETNDNAGRNYSITSKTGKIDKDEPAIILMNEVKAKITLKDNTIVYINADFANYNNISNDTEFYNNIYLMDQSLSRNLF